MGALEEKYPECPECGSRCWRRGGDAYCPYCHITVKNEYKPEKEYQGI